MSESDPNNPGGAGGSDDPWYAGFEGDLSGYVENKGWADPAAAVESYRNLEKLTGVPADRIVKLPGADADPAEWMGVYDRLGRPEKPEDYGLPAPEGGDNSFINWAQQAFHEIGLPRDMGVQLVERLQQYTQEQQTQAGEEAASKIDEEAAALRTKWGPQHDQHMQQARQAAQKLGVDAETIDVLEKTVGFSKVMELFQKVGAGMGEADFVSGDQRGGFSMTPQAAQAKIQELKADQGWVKRFATGDVKARSEMERLIKVAYPNEAAS